MDFASVVRQARKQAGLSQPELARLLVTPKRPRGVWATYVGQIEKGQKVPSEEICLKLAEVLRLDPLSLLVRAHRQKADTAETQAFLDCVLRIVTDPSAASVFSEGHAEYMYGSALDDGRLVPQGEVEYILPQLCRSRAMETLCELLKDLDDISETDWRQLSGLLRHLVLQ